ncbi:hypothetical protein KP509_13G040800 [Ceratopteris richardii]|uniref:glucan endo-1,3-beta-D-glucosidase n=1 Tax=Ceratopteris richardii TaxID=49495 RepID=A0A8T2TF70_CERRI|nr:hypothetical protein KP509_13G040800 [Ceratopteris richardii]
MPCPVIKIPCSPSFIRGRRVSNRGNLRSVSANLISVMSLAEKYMQIKAELRKLWDLVKGWSVFKLVERAFSWSRNKLATYGLVRPFPAEWMDHVPDPSPELWSSDLRKRKPLPTNSAWLNFALSKKSKPEYIHPYLISCDNGDLSFCYSDQEHTGCFLEQKFNEDICFGSAEPSQDTHRITSFDDLSVTIQLKGNITVPLVRGCPYITFIFNEPAKARLKSRHKFTITSDRQGNFHTLNLENKQTWILCSSSKVEFTSTSDYAEAKEKFKGCIRIILKNADVDEKLLKEYSETYPVGGTVEFSDFSLKYTWKVPERQVSGKLLMLSLPIHRELMTQEFLKQHEKDISYTGIDGNMKGIASSSWNLSMPKDDKVGFIQNPWYFADAAPGSTATTNREVEMADLIRKDLNMLKRIPENGASAYMYARSFAQLAQVILLANQKKLKSSEVSDAEEYLKTRLTVWIGRRIKYDQKWGGLIVVPQTTSSASNNVGYADGHHTLGYFCYAGAVLAKLNQQWGKAYKHHLCELARDYLCSTDTPKRWLHFLSGPYPFPKLRYFDLWVLHSWGVSGLQESEHGSGLQESEHGRLQLSPSEAVHAYYAGALVGHVYGDEQLRQTGLTLAFLEIKTARLLWHVARDKSVYEGDYRNYPLLLHLWASRREALPPKQDAPTRGQEDDPAKNPVNMQVCPLMPISGFLFQGYAEKLQEAATGSPQFALKAYMGKQPSEAPGDAVIPYSVLLQWACSKSGQT